MNQLLRQMLFLPEQASSMAFEIDAFHYLVIGISLLGAAGVAAATAFYLLRYQHRPDPPPAPKPLSASVEVSAIVMLLVLFCALWWVGFRQFVRLRTPPDDALGVYVVAKQWMWSFTYPNGTGSKGDLVVPVGRPIVLSMTSRDVIHSFYVPAFRVKQDVVPGRMTTLWFEVVRPGVYDIMCTEYCGAQHSTMRGRVIALDAEDWEGWRRRTAAPAEDLVTQGRRIAAERGCLRCHTLDGTPHLGPSFAGLYQAEVTTVDGRVLRADEAYLTRAMMDPLAETRRGFVPIMPSYLGVLDAGETAALIELLRALRDPTAVRPEAPPPASRPGPVDLDEAWP